MGDLRYSSVYNRVAASPDAVETLRKLDDAEVIAALAGASRGFDAYLANVIAVEALNRVERRETCMEAMAEGVLGIDEDGLVTFANPAAAEMLGHRIDELRGRLAQDALGAPLPEGPRVGRARFVRRDGAVFPAVFTLAPVERDGVAAGAVAVFRDATEETLAEEKLRAALESARGAERRARFLAEAGEVLATTREPHLALATVARLAVPALADWCLVHVPESGQLNLVAIEHADPKLREEVERSVFASPRAHGALRQVLATGEPRVVGALTESAFEQLGEDALSAPLRRMRLAGALLVPLVIHGRSLGVLSLVADQERGPFAPEDVRTAKDLARRAAIALETARLLEIERSAVRALHASVEALRISRERYRSLVEASAKLVWTTDARGKATVVPGWAELTGQPAGAPRTDAVHPDDRDALMAQWRTALDAGQPFTGRFRLRLADGSWHRFETRAVPVRSPEGTIIEWVAATSDHGEAR